MAAKQTLNQFLEKSKRIFGDTLDYSLVNYIDSRTKIILICKLHGKFEIAPKDHICYKRGCNICSGVEYDTISFVDKAKQIHKNKFNYSKTIYNGIKIPILIGCNVHGEFSQTPDKHINSKQGCPKCKKSAKKDLTYIIKMGTYIHNGKYDYSKSVFTRMFSPIIIICPKHGEFKQTPANHINHKQNCPACMVGKSKKEEQWLNQIGLPNSSSHRSVILHIDGRRFIVDGYDPYTKTVYEFYGDFWHGNPSLYNSDDINKGNKMKFGELYRKTLEREKLLNTYSYNIISIWEQEFDMQTKIDRRKRGG